VYLYYSATGKDTETIGLAISGDGFHFTKWTDNPVLSGRCPEIVLHEGTWHLFFVRKNTRGGYSIHAALSDDGLHFEDVHTPVLESENGGWDSKSVTTPRIFRDGGVFYMIYAGDDKTLDDSWRFGLAVSNNLLEWKKYDLNPIFEKGVPGAWDDSNIWFGTVEKIHNTYWMWYEGCNSCRGYPGFISAVGAAVLVEPYFFIKPNLSGCYDAGTLSQ
jgi:hypothetical protein